MDATRCDERGGVLPRWQAALRGERRWYDNRAGTPDGNYPHGTKRGERAEIVYLNLGPGLVTVTDVVKAIISAVNIEKAEVMDYGGSPVAPIMNENAWPRPTLAAHPSRPG